MSPANYHSPKRDEAKEATRAAILDALVRVVLDEGIHAFTVANVAKRAGVALRTVYRHFPSRDALLEGLSARLDAQDSAFPGGIPPQLTQLATSGEHIFSGLEGLKEAAMTEVIASVALGYLTEGKKRRWDWLQRELAAQFPDVPEDERLGAAAALRALLSGHTWFHLRIQLAIDPGIAGRGVGRAAQLLFDDLQRRQDAANRGGSCD